MYRIYYQVEPLKLLFLFGDFEILYVNINNSYSLGVFISPPVYNNKSQWMK